MNEAMIKELKVIVERVVRPVNASRWRKNSMRAEMLAHVMEAFEQERDASKDEALALERTKRRFGEPAMITRQLQAAIPKRDGYWRMFESSANETMWQAGLKFAAIELLVYFPVLLFCFWMSNAFGGMSVAETAAVFGSMAFVPLWLVMPVWLFGVAIMMKFMEQSVFKETNEWPPKTVPEFLAATSVSVRIALVAGVCSMIAMAAIPGIHWPTSIYDWNQSTLIMAGLALVDLVSLSILCAWILAMTVADRRRRHEEWAMLAIEQVA